MVTCDRGPLAITAVDYNIQRYVYPLQVAFFLGTVHRVWQGSRRSTVTISCKKSIVCLTVLDFVMILLMLPQSLASFEPFYTWEMFRRFCYRSTLSMVAVSNGISACEIFVSLLISLECYLRFKGSSWVTVFNHPVKYAKLITGVLVTSFGLTSYHFFLYKSRERYDCDGEKLLFQLYLSSGVVAHLVKLFSLTQAILVIVLPSLTIVLINKKLSDLLDDRKFRLSEIECQELFSQSDNDNELKRIIRRYLFQISAYFVFSHVMSFVPFLPDVFPVLNHPAFGYTISISTSLLLWGKLLTLNTIYKMCGAFSRIPSC